MEAGSAATLQPNKGEKYSDSITITGTAAHACLPSGKDMPRLNCGADRPLYGKTCLLSGKDT